MYHGNIVNPCFTHAKSRLFTNSCSKSFLGIGVFNKKHHESSSKKKRLHFRPFPIIPYLFWQGRCCHRRFEECDMRSYACRDICLKKGRIRKQGRKLLAPLNVVERMWISICLHFFYKILVLFQLLHDAAKTQ